MAGKIGFHVLGLGIICQKTIENENGIKYEQDSHWNDRICALGHLGWKMGIGTSLQDPLIEA